MEDEMESMLIDIAQKQGVPLNEVKAILEIEKECLDLDAKSEEPVKRIEELLHEATRA